mgnify:FL=1
MEPPIECAVCAGIDFPDWRLRAICAGADDHAGSRHRLALSPVRWLAALPALGVVLYLGGRVDRRWLDEGALPPGTLVESVELAPLLPWRSLEAVSEITRDGPREWIECRSAGARIAARLYLLPDTDYLAWDALHTGATPIVGEAGRAPPGTWHPATARLLRFRARRLGGLDILGAETASDVSLLSMQLASRLARDEVV